MKYRYINFSLRDGNFAVKRSTGKFNRVPSDQCIEQTINREQKCHGGITGYSTSPGTVQRWVLTSHIISKCISKLEEDLLIHCRPTRPKDVGPSRIKFDEKAAKRAYDVLVNWGNPFNYRDSLVHICSGVEATDTVQQDLLKAEDRGLHACKEFIRDRIQTPAVSFYSPIKKQKLKTFKDMSIKKICNAKEKAVTIAAERSMFARLLVIAKSSRHLISLKEVLSYSLSPVPWSLALPDGGLVKTVKSNLLAAIEADVISPPCEIPEGSAMIFDGMVLLQQLEKVQVSTFGDISEFVLKRITKTPSRSIYFVSDQYKEQSIKGYERYRRALGGSIRIKLERRTQKRPKQWSKYLKSGENKTDVIKFLLADWSDKDRFAELLTGIVLYVNVENNFYKLEVIAGKVVCNEEESIATNQEEADTKVFLCSKHASQSGSTHVCICTVDSDIPIYALYFQNKIEARLLVKIGVGNRTRVLDIEDISSELGPDMCKALPSLHAFTGNDYTSAFHGIGKKKAYKIVKTSDEYKSCFANFGDSFTFDASLFPILEKFVCLMYGLKCESTNEARYLKFCSKKKCPEPQQLPPTRDALLCHLKRVSYVTAIIKRSLDCYPDIPDPDGYGWTTSEEGISIVWMLRSPAPDEILELVSCTCAKTKCSTQACVCKNNGLKCTDLCGCKNCENRDNLDDDIVSDEYDSDDIDEFDEGDNSEEESSCHDESSTED